MTIRVLYNHFLKILEIREMLSGDVLHSKLIREYNDLTDILTSSNFFRGKDKHKKSHSTGGFSALTFIIEISVGLLLFPCFRMRLFFHISKNAFLAHWK